MGLPSISAPHINSEVIDCGISGVIPVKSRSVFSGIRTATFPVLLIASFHVVISVTETRVYPLGIPFVVVKVVSARTYVPLIKATV